MHPTLTNTREIFGPLKQTDLRFWVREDPRSGPEFHMYTNTRYQSVFGIDVILFVAISQMIIHKHLRNWFHTNKTNVYVDFCFLLGKDRSSGLRTSVVLSL